MLRTKEKKNNEIFLFHAEYELTPQLVFLNGKAPENE